VAGVDGGPQGNLRETAAPKRGRSSWDERLPGALAGGNRRVRLWAGGRFPHGKVGLPVNSQRTALPHGISLSSAPLSNAGSFPRQRAPCPASIELSPNTD